MGKSSPTPPPAPNPTAVAAAQTSSNIDTAKANADLNRVNQVTPWGSLKYSQDPGNGGFDQAGYDAAMKQYQTSVANGTANGDANGHGLGLTAPTKEQFTDPNAVPTWTATTTLSPEQQSLLDQQNQMSSQLGGLGVSQLGSVANSLSQPLSFGASPAVESGGIQGDIDMSGVPKLVSGDDLSSDLNTQRDSLYKQQAAYLDPQWQNSDHDLENKLVQQGVMQNSDAWNKAMDDQSRNKTFAYNQAAQSAITGGGAEQSRLFGLGLSANQNAYGQAAGNAAFHNTAQNQGFEQSLQARNQSNNEIMALRNAPLNELSALRSGSQVSAPQFGTSPQTNVAGTDVMSPINNAFNAQMGGVNAQVATNNSNTQAAAGLGTAALSAIAMY